MLRTFETDGNRHKLYEIFRNTIHADQDRGSRFFQADGAHHQGRSREKKPISPMVWIPRDNKEAKVARIAAFNLGWNAEKMHIVKGINNLTELILD